MLTGCVSFSVGDLVCVSSLHTRRSSAAVLGLGGERDRDRQRQTERQIEAETETETERFERKEWLWLRLTSSFARECTISGRPLLSLDSFSHNTTTITHTILVLNTRTCNTWQTWRLSDLAREVELPSSVVQKRMMLWVNQGVVSESNPGPVYRLVKDQVRFVLIPFEDRASMEMVCVCVRFYFIFWFWGVHAR